MPPRQPCADRRRGDCDRWSSDEISVIGNVVRRAEAPVNSPACAKRNSNTAHRICLVEAASASTAGPPLHHFHHSFWSANSMSKFATPHHNHLLDRMSADDLALLQPHLQDVRLDYLDPLYEAGRPVEFIYFPLSGVASLAKGMEDGSSAEVGTTGNEGFVGIPILLGAESGPIGVHMQVPGHAARAPARAFRRAFERSAPLRSLLYRFVYASFNQTCQLVACNRFHDIEQRCAR